MAKHVVKVWDNSVETTAFSGHISLAVNAQGAYEGTGCSEDSE